MGGLNTNKLFTLIRDYFKVYLPCVKKYSPNTLRSYQKSMELLLDYVKETRKIRLHEITFDMIDQPVLSAFLDYIEKERGCSATTRNHRLRCIRSFYQYAADTDITVVAYWNEIKRVKAAKTSTLPIEYMTEDVLDRVLAQPNTATKLGLRDMFLLLFLYQTASRVQEALDVRLSDIVIGETSVVTLRGKGSKARAVPLRDKFVQHLNRYLTTFHPARERYSDRHLFYTVRDEVPKRMTEDNVRRIVRQHGKSARQTCAQVPESLHPHIFRHSRAMHLYQHGVNLELISQWLGHSRLETTLIYAYADTEQKRIAIENAIPVEGSLKEHLNAARYTVTDEDTLKILCGLR